MKKIVLLVSVILILAIVSAIGCSNDKESPEDVVRGALNAMTSKDLKGFTTYCTEDYVDSLSLGVFEEPSEEMSIKYSNIETELISQNEDSSEVHITCDAEILLFGETFNETHYQTYYLVKVNDEWLINADYQEIPEIGPYDTERKNVQITLTALMAYNDVSTVTPQTTWINDLSGDFFSGEHTSFGEFLATDSLKAYYQWDSEGNVYQCEDTSCPDRF